MDTLPSELHLEIFDVCDEFARICLTNCSKYFYIFFSPSIKKSLYTLLLEPIDEDKYYLFIEAIKYVFELNDENGIKMLNDLKDRDYLWRPDETVFLVPSHGNQEVPRWEFDSDEKYQSYKNNNSVSINYLQWITRETEQREPIREIVSYLFYNSDPEWHEPYSFSKEEKQWRKKFYEKLIKKYSEDFISKYFKNVSKKLWRHETFMNSNFNSQDIEARIKKFIKTS